MTLEEFEAKLQDLIGKARDGSTISLVDLIGSIDAEVDGLRMVEQEGEEF